MARTRLATRSDGASPAPRLVARAIEKKKKEEKKKKKIEGAKAKEMRRTEKEACGGDRDKSKRPLMAKVACNYSQQTILTSDNPRTEAPEAILEDMQAGVPPYAVQKTLIIQDRRQAIRTACRLARTGDIVLVAGKGHEKYQEIKGVKYPFDDKKELKTELNSTN